MAKSTGKVLCRWVLLWASVLLASRVLQLSRVKMSPMPRYFMNGSCGKGSLCTFSHDWKHQPDMVWAVRNPFCPFLPPSFLSSLSPCSSYISGVQVLSARPVLVWRKVSIRSRQTQIQDARQRTSRRKVSPRFFVCELNFFYPQLKLKVFMTILYASRFLIACGFHTIYWHKNLLSLIPPFFVCELRILPQPYKVIKGYLWSSPKQGFSICGVSPHYLYANTLQTKEVGIFPWSSSTPQSVSCWSTTINYS